MYKDNWTQPWPMGSEIYPKVHENPRAFFSRSSPIFLEPLAHGSSDWSLPREDCITKWKWKWKRQSKAKNLWFQIKQKLKAGRRWTSIGRRWTCAKDTQSEHEPMSTASTQRGHSGVKRKKKNCDGVGKNQCAQWRGHDTAWAMAAWAKRQCGLCNE